MSDQFSTKGHEVTEKEYISEYIKPGIHVAKVKSVEYVESAGGTKGIRFIHEGKPMSELDGKGQIAETTLWMSEKAWPYTKDRLVVMADKLGVREKLDAISSDNESEYAIALNSVFGGKAARWKFSGVEIEGKMDEEKGEKKPNWVKAELASFGFCESLNIPENESKLKYDPANKYDFKRLPVADIEHASTMNGSATKEEAESPWE